MKFKVFGNITEFQGAFDRLLDKDISLKAAYKLKTVKDAIMAEYQKYDQMRKELVLQYSEKDDKGEIKTHPNTNIAVFAGGNEKLFYNKIKELQEIEFPAPVKIKLSELGDITMRGQDLIVLSDLIEE